MIVFQTRYYTATKVDFDIKTKVFLHWQRPNGTQILDTIQVESLEVQAC